VSADRTDLPLLGERPERADAARNRQRILAAAEALVAERGVDALSMDEVAERAGVGVGTVYRRFGDRSGLAYALLDHGERAFQEALLAGPPPLGPGAPARERLGAFLAAYVRRLESEAQLLQMAETDAPGARYTSKAYGLHHAHVATLVAEIDRDADADYLADALLAPLDASLYRHQRDRGVDVARVTAGLTRLLEGFDERPSPSGE
jgi:AcrR family transcriptional regulator